MELEIDPDIKAVAEFMQQTLAASKLVPVATAIGRLAPILWGHFDTAAVFPLQLVGKPISGCDPPIPPCANG
jgi:hypothetical protein